MPLTAPSLADTRDTAAALTRVRALWRAEARTRDRTWWRRAARVDTPRAELLRAFLTADGPTRGHRGWRRAPDGARGTGGGS